MVQLTNGNPAMNSDTEACCREKGVPDICFGYCEKATSENDEQARADLWGPATGICGIWSDVIGKCHGRSKTDSALDFLNLVSTAEVVNHDKEKRTVGLTCYKGEAKTGLPAKVLYCDDMGGANFCVKIVGPLGSFRTCAFEPIMKDLRRYGLTSAGCLDIGVGTICLCTGNKCN